jgi:hypothetical protein
VLAQPTVSQKKLKELIGVQNRRALSISEQIVGFVDAKMRGWM